MDKSGNHLRAAGRLAAHISWLTLLLAAGPALAQDGAPSTGQSVVGQIFDQIEPVTEAGLHGFFQLLDNQPIAFVLLALTLGTLIGKISFKTVSLGSTAGTLLVGVILSMIAEAAYGITYSIPGILSSFMLLLFMYALGLKVGPQFFSGLRKGGLAFVGIGVIVWVLNWVICYFGAKLVGLAPGYATGLISGSYTITAILGVGQGAMTSGAYVPPDGMTVEEVGANMAAAYAISYVLSTVGIILLIRYLPRIFGYDAEADAKRAEAEYTGGAMHPVPGAPGALTMSASPYDLRAFSVTHYHFLGRSISQLAADFPHVPILRVVRDHQIVELSSDPVIAAGDIVTVRSNVHDLILEEGELIGPESDDQLARNVPLEVADVHIGSHAVSGETIAKLESHGTGGVEVQALFRAGNELPLGPDSDVRFGDVLRLTGPDAAIKAAAKQLGGHAILPTMKSEVLYLALAMLVGYLVGIVTVTVSGIPFALGTSAGVIMAGVGVSYFRSRNPNFGGPVHEGARSFLQDFGLNAFVAVLSANVGPKVISALGGDTIMWLALIGIAGALIPPLVAFWVGVKVFGLNSIISDGATTGGRNSTPGLNAIMEESKSSVAAVPYPVSYALTTVLALIGGYFSMILS
ncbi:aspartate:alanine exchanger family transporter [Pacificibacter marinus]|uniref:Aspartate/alanine antiporter n=1 Tax=Pacificibacter marinus TaxID=658057 RepID=A0A1Y5TR25_9RHOB|nr:transporter [Pacificibacter marinus]SEK55062.1 putative transport protein [Pacificibacter marinus]SLN67771.1 Aspartate/alanine antiporter [Pacificibacter marinus]